MASASVSMRWWISNSPSASAGGSACVRAHSLRSDAVVMAGSLDQRGRRVCRLNTSQASSEDAAISPGAKPQRDCYATPCDEKAGHQAGGAREPLVVIVGMRVRQPL